MFVKNSHTLVLLAASIVSCDRIIYNLNSGWKIELNGHSTPAACKDANSTFPRDMTGKQCLGLQQVGGDTINSAEECQNTCCASSTCAVWQWADSTPAQPLHSCWTGTADDCNHPAQGWISRARASAPAPGPASGNCTVPECDPGTDDSSWRIVDIPHDFVVEGTFSQSGDKSHGYLPYGKAWYRKHFASPASVSPSMYITFDGIQTSSTAYLNGVLLGSHQSGYTPSRYWITPSMLKPQNLLAVEADATHPDGWWYDGGGMYRDAWLTVVTTAGPFIAPHGVYVPSNVTGSISWSAGVPAADGTVLPSVEVATNASGADQAFHVRVEIMGPTGASVGSVEGDGRVSPGTPTVWQASSPVSISGATLWHLVEPPSRPALYTAVTTLTVGGVVADVVTETFGIRRAEFRADTGFWLNGVNTKIMGNANHQDFAGVGVAVPNHLQYFRVQKLKDMGANGWRTAHNAPTPALLDAADELGFLVWDENHRNGQNSECEILVKRDRNHPSVVIWSVCNEVLCNSKGNAADAKDMKENCFEKFDPLGQRPVSANQNGWIGPNTPLDVQGFDYATGSYDKWHKEAPNIPCISSETSSAVSDRGEYVNNPQAGYVRGYDTEHPGWGGTAQQAWGGVGIQDGQGILTRPYVSGGWTWTGFDYKGEPTPDAWPNVNSHFGIIDLAGFPKDRYYWYRSWFAQPKPTPELHLFPHWNWDSSFNLPIWCFSNADEVELFVNGQSQGKKTMPRFAHVEWDGIKWAAGKIEAVAYVNGTAVANHTRVTAGAPSALKISVKDGVGTTLAAGCQDVALVQVEVVDSAGTVVPITNNNITFAVTGPATLAGTGNGDPSCHVNDKSATRPAWHGLALAVVAGGTDAGTVTVSASSPGMQTVSVTIQQVAPTSSTKWCHNGPHL